MIKSCPFCGGEAAHKTSGPIERYKPHWVKCNDCGGEGPVRESKKDAIEAWNRRVNGGSGNV